MAEVWEGETIRTLGWGLCGGGVFGVAVAAGLVDFDGTFGDGLFEEHGDGGDLFEFGEFALQVGGGVPFAGVAGEPAEDAGAEFVVVAAGAAGGRGGGFAGDASDGFLDLGALVFEVIDALLDIAQGFAEAFELLGLFALSLFFDLRDGFQCFFSKGVVSSLGRIVLFCHDRSLQTDSE